MKNTTNIYDIDGEIIRQADDNHKMTIEEAQERMKYYGKKAEEEPEKADIYRVYVRNLSNYVYNLISQMSQDEFSDYVSNTIQKPTETSSEEVEKALNEVVEDMPEEPKTLKQEDMLVERDVEPTKMDEYVEFEES